MRRYLKSGTGRHLCDCDYPCEPGHLLCHACEREVRAARQRGEWDRREPYMPDFKPVVHAGTP